MRFAHHIAAVIRCHPQEIGTREHITQSGGVALPSGNQLTGELGLYLLMAPRRTGWWRLNTSAQQRVDGALETGVVATVRTVVVAAIRVLALGTSETLLCLPQIGTFCVNHAPIILLFGTIVNTSVPGGVADLLPLVGEELACQTRPSQSAIGCAVGVAGGRTGTGSAQARR